MFKVYLHILVPLRLPLHIYFYIYKKSAIHDLPLSQSVNVDSTIILKFKFLKTKSTCKIKLLKYKLLLSRYLSESYIYMFNEIPKITWACSTMYYVYPYEHHLMILMIIFKTTLKFMWLSMDFTSLLIIM